MCPGAVACDPVRNIPLLLHVTQLWPMAYAHCRPAPDVVEPTSPSDSSGKDHRSVQESAEDVSV